MTQCIPKRKSFANVYIKTFYFHRYNNWHHLFTTKIMLFIDHFKSVIKLHFVNLTSNVKIVHSQIVTTVKSNISIANVGFL